MRTVVTALLVVAVSAAMLAVNKRRSDTTTRRCSPTDAGEFTTGLARSQRSSRRVR